MTRKRRKTFRSRRGGCPAALLSLIILLIVGGAWTESPSRRVDRLFAPWNKPDSPGCAVAVIHNGRILYTRGYGMANLEHQIPITPETVFYVGSVSKQFVAFCIALLSRDGLLSLDDDIRLHLPEMPEYGAPVTLRHCLHHTGGLRDYLTLLGIAGIPFGYFHQEEAFNLIKRQQDLNFLPGTEHLYSNSGYLLLAEVIERVSGQSLRRFAHERIFKPLGMDSSHFHDDYTRLIPNRAAGYLAKKQGGGYKNFISTFDCVGSGGLFTTVNDIYLWDQNFETGKLGGRDLIELIQVPGRLADGKTTHYAFGLKLGNTEGLNHIGHSGSMGGYRSAYLRFPEHRFSVICFANLSDIDPFRLCEDVAAIYLADAVKNARLVRKKMTDQDPEEITLPLSKMADKSGIYTRLSSGETIGILFQNGALNARWRGRTYRLQPLNDADFLLGDFMQRKIYLSFKKRSGESMYDLHFRIGRGRVLTYVPLRTTHLPDKRLPEYAGLYYSEELQRSFRISLKRGALTFTHPNAPTEPLRYLPHDTFMIGDLYLRFQRGDDDHITGFLLDAGRVRNLKFIKRAR